MILIALGANLPSRFGSPPETLRAVPGILQDKGIVIAGMSRLWESAPVPVSDQPWYCNAVARVETDLTPPEILRVLHGVEAAFGRVRERRNEARLLDLDLIACHDEIMSAPDLILPHPRLHERAFVLYPLRDVAPQWIHPVLKESVSALIGKLPPGQDVRPMGGPDVA